MTDKDFEPLEAIFAAQKKEPDMVFSNFRIPLKPAERIETAPAPVFGQGKALLAAEN